MLDTFSGNIQPHPIEDEIKESFLSYAMSVIVARALPDVRDGLKPVHRRVLYAMHDLGLQPNRRYRKSATVVGEVIGKYHPHGDQAVYDTLVRLAQDFSLRYPLVDGQGNFGSVDGDSAGAMRYTEARLARIATEMLRDINADTVDFVPNFDEQQREPEVLPARFPNLLVNGADGIAVGMATRIPPHNLGEVIDATVALIDDPEMEDERLLEYIKGPDFPTGGVIVGTSGIREAVRTGRGSIRVRAKAHTENIRGNRTQIVVTEIPYQVNKAQLLQKIAQLVKERRITDISDLRDESDRNGMRIVIELKREAVPKVVLNNLYKHTQLQQSFGVNMVALVDGVPRTLSYKQAIKHYIDHQFEVVTRRTRYELERARARAHILEGLLVALANLDEVVETIRRSRSVESARNNLIRRFRLSERQAQAILDLRLQRLTGMERQKVEREHRDLVEKIEYLEGVLADESKVYEIIKAELLEIKAAYGDERRTQITLSEDADFEIEDLIAEEEVVISITGAGYLKSVPVNSFRKQGRGGVGVNGMELKEGDFIEHLFITTTHHYMLFFTNKGKVYRLKVHQLPRMSRTARGRHVANLLPLSQDEHIAAVIATRDFGEAEYLLFATRRGIVKKTEFSEYNTPLKNEGIIAIKLAEGDELIDVRHASKGDEVILVTREGKALRFRQDEARAMGRATAGVKGITLKEGDDLLSMDVISDDAADLFLITEKGYGKRTPLSQFRTQGRGGQGVIAMKTGEERGRLSGVRVVKPDLHELVIVSNLGTTIRIDAGSVSRQGRSAQGVRVMNLHAGDSVSAVAKVVASRSSTAGEAGVSDELSLEDIVGEEPRGASEAGLPEADRMEG
ncbi:DNA gyrase subunit A [Rubrobacter calidifluminis]|uniref:DNA gyrase subunit A n=1 Tax=Rubrobacter calidifluminis TaxID=1392640 RepID=UPI002361DAA1|nr:DNA gyrase subunit A [Rubrobacter calidifluminis]